VSTPIITICGRPNVGKSTLFNRLTGRRKSIVSEIPGTTRDSIQTNCLWNDKSFILVDSGGIETHSDSQITQKVIDKSYESINEADHILFVVDATSGITNEDTEILRIIRKIDKEITLVINKVDNSSREENISDFFVLGLGEGINISAYHGNGIFDLMNSLEHLFSVEEVDDESIKFSIIGRPNVGKSTLFNSMIGQAKSIVSEIPGTTRDSVDSKFEYKNNDYKIVDTAGIRRKGKIGKEIEYFSVLRTIKAISESHISLLVIDSTENVTLQDQHIAGLIRESGNGCVLVMNKLDLIDKEKIKEKEIIEKLKFFPGIPLVYTSAKLKSGMSEMLKELISVNRRYRQNFSDDEIWKNILNIISSNMPPSKGKRRVYPTSAKQIGSNPPKIQIKFHNAELVHFSYKRYIENELRNIFDLRGVPLQLEILEK
tara:strand:+ start:30807 stop:32096 length:1290 start_codon:yes stop_codon:yes gene_type:complete